jgi:hypothetical protein
MYLRPMGAAVPSIYGESYDARAAREAWDASRQTGRGFGLGGIQPRGQDRQRHSGYRGGRSLLCEWRTTDQLVGTGVRPARTRHNQ